MIKNDGYIYILTNPSFPNYVKIGYADDVESRVDALNRSECTPFAFCVYAKYKVQARLTDIKVHDMIDRINPTLRSIDNVNGKKRIREFFAMSAEDAYLLFEAMAEIHGTTHLLEKVSPNQEQIDEEEAANVVEEVARERRIPFPFELIGIKPGEEVEFWYSAQRNLGIKCRVKEDSKHIEHDGISYSLSSFAAKMTNQTSVAGPTFFKYNGEWLNVIRHRLGV